MKKHPIEEYLDGLDLVLDVLEGDNETMQKLSEHPVVKFDSKEDRIFGDGISVGFKDVSRNLDKTKEELTMQHSEYLKGKYAQLCSRYSRIVGSSSVNAHSGNYVQTLQNIKMCLDDLRSPVRRLKATSLI